MKPIIISIDDFKEKITGYNPEKAERFHAQSAKLANKEFDKVVRTTKIKRVILLSGGSASGKTEYMMTYLVNKNAVIFDSTLPTTEGAKIKIISSHYDHAHKKMIYKDKLFGSSKELLDYIKSIQYNNQEDIKKGIVIYDRKNIKTR